MRTLGWAASVGRRAWSVVAAGQVSGAPVLLLLLLLLLLLACMDGTQKADFVFVVGELVGRRSGFAVEEAYLGLELGDAGLCFGGGEGMRGEGNGDVSATVWAGGSGEGGRLREDGHQCGL